MAAGREYGRDAGGSGEEAGLLFSALEKCITLLSTPSLRPLPQKVILQVEQNLKKWSFTDVQEMYTTVMRFFSGFASKGNSF